MALIQKDSNGNQITLANTGSKWAVYNTKAAAEDALVNDELAEGMIVGVMESPGVITEGSSVITTATATLPVTSGSEQDIYTYTNTTATNVDLYASYYNNYNASDSGYYAGFYARVNDVTTVAKVGEAGGYYSSISLLIHLRPGDTVVLRGKRTNSALAATVDIAISTPTLEYHTDTLYAIEPNYSTTEVNTGRKWIDGKPIYSKVFTGLTRSQAVGQWVNTGANITGLNIDVIISFNAYDSTTSINRNAIDIRHYSGQLQYYTGFENPFDICTLEYTKTTD